MKYSFLILAYKDYKSLNSLISRLSTRQEQEYEILVHDNTPEEDVQEIHREAKLSHGKRGIGFAAGCNRLAAMAKGENLVFLNPDTEPEGDWLERLEKGFEAGFDAMSVTSDYIAGVQKKEFWTDYPRPFVQVKLIIPIVMLIKAETFKEMDGFDESFFLGCEDLDFSWRMNRAGKRMGIATDVFVHHIGHTGFSQTPDREKIIAAGEARIREKLKAYYGNLVPSSEELWGCKILATELKPMRLSVCMITRNAVEDMKVLVPTLSFADEIVVCDTTPESPSYTVTGEMAWNRDCKFIGVRFPWVDNFAAARNFALSKCTGDWVLWLDADDRISPESAALIDALIHKPGNNVALQACHFAFKVENTDKDGNIRDAFVQARLFPRLPGIEWGGLGGCKGLVHETYFENCEKIGLPMVQVNNITIQHTGYSDPALEKVKANRNLALLLKEPDNAFKWYNVGCSYMAMGELDKAVDGFRKALEIVGSDDKGFTDNIRYNLAMSLSKQESMTTEVYKLLAPNTKPDAKWLLGMLKVEYGEVEEGCDLLWAYLKMGDIQDNLGTNCPVFRKAAVNALTEIGVLKV